MTLEEFGLRPEVIAGLQRSSWRVNPAEAQAGIAALRAQGFDVFPAAEVALSVLWGARFEVGDEGIAGVDCSRVEFVVDPLGAISEFDNEGVSWMRAIANYLGQSFVPLGQDLRGSPKGMVRGNRLLIALRNEEVVYLEYGDGFVRVGSPIADALSRLALGLQRTGSLQDLPEALAPF